MKRFGWIAAAVLVALPLSLAYAALRPHSATAGKPASIRRTTARTPPVRSRSAAEPSLARRPHPGVLLGLRLAAVLRLQPPAPASTTGASRKRIARAGA